MKPFAYADASTPDAALALAKPGSRFLAGGIDLIAELKNDIVSADLLINVAAMPGMAGIKKSGDRWQLAPNTTVSQIAAHDDLAAAFPGLRDAAMEVGSPQIRHVATLAGNLAQHSRCWYYRHKDVLCLKKGGDMCHARQDENRYHSLFSGNPCISPVVSNLSVILTTLGAEVLVRRGNDTLRWSMPQLYEKAWTESKACNSLETSDLITGIEIPALTAQRSAYLQISEKAMFDWALVSCAAAAVVDSKRLINPRVCLGSIAPVPYMSDEANKFLANKTLTEDVALKAADLLLANAEPQTHNGYKVPLARTLIKRALLKLVA